MVDRTPTVLIPFSFHSVRFNHLQLWTLNGNIRVSFFSHPMFLPKFLFKNLHLQILEGKTLDSFFFSCAIFLLKFSQCFHGSKGYLLSIVLCSVVAQHQWKWILDGRSWIPTVFIPFSFHSLFLITCHCELWMVRSWFPFFLKVHFHSCCARTAAQNYR